MTTREWENATPWRKLAEVAKRVVKNKQIDHAKPNDANIHADTRDFEEEFELPIKLLIAETELRVIMAHASREQPSFRNEAFAKQEEINKLHFEMAKRVHP